MQNVQLRKAVMGKKQVTYEKKPSLYAQKCDCCGKLFRMGEYYNDDCLAELIGTFDISSLKDGNIFLATVCSFKCADEMFNGKWKDMSEYKEFKKKGAKLARCQLKITAYIKEEAELISEWEKSND